MFQVGPVGDRLRKYPDISTVHLFSNTDVALIISGVRRNLASKVISASEVDPTKRAVLGSPGQEGLLGGPWGWLWTEFGETLEKCTNAGRLLS